MHFTDQVNLRNKDVINLLLPLGIPDIEEQQIIMNKTIIKEGDRPVNVCKTVKGLTNQVKYYGNQSRFSATNLDAQMISEMRNIYGHYLHGYIQPNSLPTCWHYQFPSEMCLFDLSTSFLIPLPVTGGNKLEKYMDTSEKEKKIEPILFLPKYRSNRAEYLNGYSYLYLREGYTKTEVEEYRKTGKAPPLAKNILNQIIGMIRCLSVV